MDKQMENRPVRTQLQQPVGEILHRFQIWAKHERYQKTKLRKFVVIVHKKMLSKLENKEDAL